MWDHHDSLGAGLMNSGFSKKFAVNFLAHKFTIEEVKSLHG